MHTTNTADYVPSTINDAPVRRQLGRIPGIGMVKSIINTLTGAGDDQWCRIVMNRECLKIVQSIKPETLETLEISGDLWQRRATFKSYRSVHFPEYVLCAAALPETYDLIIAEQVFEHLLWPHRAARHIHQMLRPGGRLLISTPFMIRVHPCPVDCCRWTETGMKHLLADCGWSLDKIVTGSWGNRACVKGNLKRWVRYRSLFHSLKNEPEFPFVVWALAEK